MATVNPLLQQIDAIAKEKGVEPEIIISAVQDALEAAARKKYKGEELRARFNPETGEFDLFTVKKIVDGSDRRGDAVLARRSAASCTATRRKSTWKIEFPRRQGGSRPHRRADRQAGDLPEGARGRARERLRRVQPAHRRSRQRHGQALRERRHHHRARPRRSAAAAQGTVARGELHRRRPRARRHPRREPQRQGSADRAVAHRSGAAHQAVRAGSAGDLRRHRDDPRRGARSRRSRQGRGLLARARRRSGRRLRRHEGHARAVDHPRAARREDRHRRMVGRSDRRS